MKLQTDKRRAFHGKAQAEVQRPLIAIRRR